MEEATMASKEKQTGRDNDALEFFRGGKAIPENVVQQCLSEVQKRRKAQFEQASGTRQQMSKYLSQIKSSSTPDAADPQTAKALDGLLGLHKKLADRKLAAPKIPRGLGGILPGKISATVVAPFDYDLTIPTVLAGNEPTLTGSADKNTGQMSVSCLTSTQHGFGGGSMYAVVGIYFHPVTSGTLTVYAAPRYSFQWWTNSVSPSSLVTSFGSGGLTIYGVDVASSTIKATAGNEFLRWDETETDQVLFGSGFDLQTPVSAHLEVGHTLVYLLFVEAFTHVVGVGWPGSLAGAMMSVTVPSITYDFEISRVFAP
jgi:hypothetical protein